MSLNHIPPEAQERLPRDVMWDSEVSYSPVMRLAPERGAAMRKMAMMQQIHQTLCDLDCGSCGAPTCRALAEDIVNGDATPDDCIINLRHKLNQILGDDHAVTLGERDDTPDESPEGKDNV